jgi:hypothetical protein
MAFVAAGIWFALRHLSGFSSYFIIGFLALFSLFWIRDLLFGLRLKLLSDGVTLQWQEGKKIGSVPVAQVRKILIGVQKPIQIGDGGVLGWTHIRFRLSTGTEHALPPNIASGLSSWKWRLLKRLVSHIRTVTNVSVEPIVGQDLTLEGWKDEPDGCTKDIRPRQSG